MALHLGDFAFGYLQVGAGGRFQVDDKLRGVGSREECDAEVRDAERRLRSPEWKARQSTVTRPSERGLQQYVVTFQKFDESRS